MKKMILLSLALSICGMAQNITKNVIFDATHDIKNWSNQRDEERLNREFQKSTHTMEGDQLIWNFIPKGDTGFNDLFYHTAIQKPCTQIIVELTNLGEPFIISAKMGDANGAEWTIDPKPIPTWKPGDPQQTLQCGWTNWKHASWSQIKEGPLAFPIRYFTIIAFGIKSGKEYKLAVKSIKIEEVSLDMTFDNPPQIPTQATGGTRLPVPSFTTKLSEPLFPLFAELQFAQGSTVFSRIPLSFNLLMPSTQITLKPEGPLPLPWILRKGDYQLRVNMVGNLANGMPNVTASASLGTVNLSPMKPFLPHTVAEVKPHNGTPTIFINGQPHSGMAYAAYGPNPQVYRDFTSVDVDLFTICATPTESGYNISPTAWKSKDEYDFSIIDQRVAMILQSNPKAYIFPRLYLHAPKWWCNEHPDDVVIAEKPDGTRYVFPHTSGRPAPSWASQAWREDTIKGLRKLIEYVEDSPYANNFIGYHLASGTTEEWMMWGSNENAWVDYSPANIRYFRKWLADKYKTDDALQKAWNDENVTLATAEIPSYKQRAESKLGYMRNPQTEMQVIDFYTYNSWLVADTITTFATAVKDICKHEKTVGVFYGYLLQLCGEQRQQNSGHNALRKILECPDIDFICSPTSYAFRQLGGKGTCHFMSLVDSVKLHGKLWFDENDVRTSLSPGKVGGWGKPENVEGDIIQQDKELACVLTNGVVQWWFDVGGNRYNTPKLLAALKNYCRVAKITNELDRSSVTKAAYIIDEDSLAYLRTGDHIGGELTLGRLPQIHRGGFPVGHFLASDIDKLTDCKLLVIANAVAPSEELRQKVEKMKGDGRVIVFLNNAGVIADGQFAPEKATSFMGINVAFNPQAPMAKGNMIFKKVAGICDGLPVGYGNPQFVHNPAVLPNDPLATVIAVYPDGRPAVAIKKFEDWMAVYCAQPQLPAQLFRNLAKLAGVHQYIETPDVVWANKSMLAVCVDQPGKRAIKLPRPAKVTELYSNKVISAEPVKTFTVDFPENATLLFRLD